MQDKVGIHIGMSFLEASLTRGGDTTSKRYFLAEISEKDAIDNFFSENSIQPNTTVQVSTKWAERIIDKRIGSNLAMFVTEGFQNWPALRQPAFNKRFTRLPIRKEAVISSDSIFGISERVDAEGNIEKSPSSEELEFLHSKLQLMNVETISIGFLHSHKNSENEKSVAKIFKDWGYEVLCSHEQKEANEVARWWRSALDAYVVELFTEYKQELAPIQDKYSVQFNYLDNHGKVFTDDHSKFFASRFGRSTSFRTKHKDNEHLLYLGLEEFLYLQPAKIKSKFQSEFGPIGVRHSMQLKMGIQPTQIIAPSEWKIFQFERKELGFEPGPMLMGKSVTPCFLDLLFVDGQIDSLKSLEKQIRPNSKSRILESMYTFTKGTEFESKLDDLVERMRETAYKKLCIQLGNLVDKKQEVVLTGPLAEIMYPSIKKKMANTKITLDANSDFIDSLCALSVENEA